MQASLSQARDRQVCLPCNLPCGLQDRCPRHDSAVHGWIFYSWVRALHGEAAQSRGNPIPAPAELCRRRVPMMHFAPSEPLLPLLPTSRAVESATCLPRWAACTQQQQPCITAHLPGDPVQVEREHEGLAAQAGSCQGCLTASMPPPNYHHVIVLLIVPCLSSRRSTGLQNRAVALRARLDTYWS